MKITEGVPFDYVLTWRGRSLNARPLVKAPSGKDSILKLRSLGFLGGNPFVLKITPFLRSFMNLNKIKKAYFIGIKGVGMTALAQVLKGRGIAVSGSDTSEEFFTDKVLRKLSIPVVENFDRQNIPADVDLVIVSAAYLATRVNNPEVKEAEKRKLPLLTYAQVLGMLFQEKYGLAVAGTHGKSTVTAMLGLILEKAGFDPTVIVGTEVLQWQSNARVGQSEYFVAEADEYRNNFLSYSPKALILTNLEYDHPDFFKNFKEYQEAFKKLIKKIPPSGFIICQANNKNVEQVIKKADCPVVRYDLKQLQFNLKAPGQHNLLNALAAQAAARQLGVKDEIIKTALLEFGGTRRRFEIKDKKEGVVFIDDYAHHPSEIKAALEAARSLYPRKKIWAVFQPHTFSRTKALLKDFARSFNQADQVIILDIYGSAREKQGTIHSQDLLQAVKKYKKEVRYISTLKEAKEFLNESVGSGQIVLTMGAGDVWKISTGRGSH